MGAWAYCTGDDCNQSIQQSDYDIHDVVNQEFACKSCGLIQPVAYYTIADLLTNMHDRLCELEKVTK